MNIQKLLAAVAAFNNKPDDSGVSISVACAILERSPASIWRDIAAGRLESFTIGSSRRIKVGSIRRACTTRRAEA
ncbi:MAG: transcriptional regulator [Proteobacteria bacterium]|nr:transcriptional regulator [Pseudomonadota bacterium]